MASGHHPIRLSIELERTGETVSGQIAVDGSQPSEFFGWLELIDRITRAARGRRSVAGDVRLGGAGWSLLDAEPVDHD